MWKKIGTAIAAALQAMSRTVFKLVEVGGKIVMMPFRVVDKIFGPGAGPQAQSAAAEGAEQAQQSEANTDQARELGDYAANLRGLARRRFQGLAIDDSLWERLTPELRVYVESLSLAECELVSGMRVKALKSLLDGKGEAIEGLRQPAEVLTSSPSSSNAFSTKKTMIELKAANPTDFNAIRNLIDSSISNTKHVNDEEEPITVRRI